MAKCIQEQWGCFVMRHEQQVVMILKNYILTWPVHPSRKAWWGGRETFCSPRGLSCYRRPSIRKRWTSQEPAIYDLCSKQVIIPFVPNKTCRDKKTDQPRRQKWPISSLVREWGWKGLLWPTAWCALWMHSWKDMQSLSSRHNGRWQFLSAMNS